MPIMCDECKCSMYYNDETDIYACENGCECCNNPDYKSTEDQLSEIIAYIKVHRISLMQDLEKLEDQMEQLDPESKDFRDLDFEFNYTSGQINGIGHILDYIDKTLTKE